MSHEVETMMYAREVPWHRLGTAVDQEVEARAAIKLGGLDWECEKRPVFLSGAAQVDGIPVIGQAVENRKAVVRKTDDKILGLVTDAYKIIQNSDCFGFMDSIIGEGQAVYHTAGSLYGGRIVFLTVKLPEDAIVGPDKVSQYILLFSSHDGTQSLSVRWTPVRVVCANTLEFAQGNCSQTFHVRHRENYQTKIDEARNVMDLTRHYYKQMEIQFNKMLETPFEVGHMVSLAKQLIPISEDRSCRSTASARKVVQLTNLFEEGLGHKEVGKNRWAAYNAVTEFVDHHATYRAREGVDPDENKLNSIIFGGGHEFKQKAFDLLAV
jgi:phage/plasmid-like protein (TIGR03299 family)